MSGVPEWALDALSEVYDPCCREKGISVVDMGLVRSVRENGGAVRVELLLTSGWCPFAARVLTSQLTEQAKRKILGENLLRLHGMDVQEARARFGRPAR
jgi:metal-sulfur cluster biosynthetic enzyme